MGNLCHRLQSGKAQSLRFPQSQPPLLSSRAVVVPRPPAVKGVETWPLAPATQQADGRNAPQEPPFLETAGRQPGELHDPASADHVPARAIRGPPAVGHVHSGPAGHPGNVPVVHHGASRDRIRGSRRLLPARGAGRLLPRSGARPGQRNPGRRRGIAHPVPHAT